MKKTFTFIATFLPLLTFAQTFTTIKQNPITSVKDQNKSGTCWDFATLGLVESEILRTSGKTYNLCEMFVANKNYMDCATHHVRMHGFSQICEGGSADDVFEVIKNYGICPENAMPAPGSLVGDTLANFNEFRDVYKEVVKYYGTGTNHTKPADASGLAYEGVSTVKGWQDSVQNVLDKYLGKCPKTFEYEGKTYTPQSFAATLGIDWNNYISLTSFTHHPFYENFVIEAMHKWRLKPSFNLPIDRLMTILDQAVERGFCVAWGGDVSGDFEVSGIAKLNSKLDPDKIQQLRQTQWDNWQFTYDHVMLIYGIAKGSDGQKYYMVKNSWGTRHGHNGIWYMSEDYIKLNTTYIYLCKDAVKGKMLKP